MQNIFKIKSFISTYYWNLFCEEKYPSLWRTRSIFNNFFSSTYLWQTVFSTITVIKTKYRSHLTDD